MAGGASRTARLQNFSALKPGGRQPRIRHDVNDPLLLAPQKERTRVGALSKTSVGPHRKETEPEATDTDTKSDQAQTHSDSHRQATGTAPRKHGPKKLTLGVQQRRPATTLATRSQGPPRSLVSCCSRPRERSHKTKLHSWSFRVRLPNFHMQPHSCCPWHVDLRVPLVAVGSLSLWVASPAVLSQPPA